MRAIVFAEMRMTREDNPSCERRSLDRMMKPILRSTDVVNEAIALIELSHEN